MRIEDEKISVVKSKVDVCIDMHVCHNSQLAYKFANITNFDHILLYGTPFRPILLDYRECHPSQPQDNLKKAFTVAMKLGMAKLIDPDEGLRPREKERDKERERQ